MIPKIVGAQVAVLILGTLIAYFAYGGLVAVSMLAAGVSLLIPNLFLAINMLFSKFSAGFFWFGVIFNKFIVLALFFLSIKIIKEPDLFAFSIGIILVTQVPLAYILLSSLWGRRKVNI